MKNFWLRMQLKNRLIEFWISLLQTLHNIIKRKQKAIPEKIIPNHPNGKEFICIPLSNHVRFVNTPHLAGDGLFFLQRAEEQNFLADRIVFSNGGAYLINGYRGVGKTSFVNEVIDQAKSILSGQQETTNNTKLIPVFLNLARELSPSEIMFMIIRKLEQTLKEGQIFNKLDKELRERIEQAVIRTSFNVKRNESKETAFKYKFGFPDLGLDSGVGKVALGSFFDFSREHLSQKGLELESLGYNDKTAESDILDILQQLNKGYRSSWSRKQTHLKIVFILDELDKLDSKNEISSPQKNIGESDYKLEPSKRDYLMELLSVLKNLFNNPNSVFIFIAGKGMHINWQNDLRKIDSLYDSIFSDEIYIPCLWELPDQYLEQIVEKGIDKNQDELVKAIKGLVRYLSRGIPRRVFREINSLISRHGNQFYLCIDGLTQNKAQLLNLIEDQVLQQNSLELRGDSLHHTSPKTYNDEIKMCSYFIIDILLGFGRKGFSIEDIDAIAKEIIPEKTEIGKEELKKLIENVLKILVSKGFIYQENLDEKNQAGTHYFYWGRWVINYLEQLSGITSISIHDEIVIDISQKFRILNLIQSKQGTDVYKAIHIDSGKVVALKITKATTSQPIREMMENEASILSYINTPNIVKLIDNGEYKNSYFLATEFIDGGSLDLEILKNKTGVAKDHNKASILVREIAKIVKILHDLDIFRLDLKPSNILINKNTNMLCLIGLGVAVCKNQQIVKQNENWVHIGLGDRTYKAPELFIGKNEEIDKRVDIFSLGIIFYELLAGRIGIYPEIEEDLEKSPQYDFYWEKIPSQVREFILKCISSNPANRFNTIDIFLAEINKLFTITDTINYRNEVIVEVSKNIDYVKNKEYQHTEPGLQNKPIPLAGSSLSNLPKDYYANILKALRDSSNFPGQFVPSFSVLKAPYQITLEPIQRDRSSIKISITKEEYAIGRDASCDIVFDDQSISRFHASIIISEKSVGIRDNLSDAGTYLNGKKLPGMEFTLLHPNDILRFAEFEYVVIFSPTSSSILIPAK